MFSNISNLLNNLDNVAKETLEEPKESATVIRSRRKKEELMGISSSNSATIGGSGIGNSGSNGNLSGSLASGSHGEALAEMGQSPLDASEDDASSAQEADGPSSTNNPTELRKLLSKKKKEIEKLNSECLELEETVTCLRKEIADAWDSYKIAQERSAIREEEYQDEIAQIQRAKATDKLQWQAQLTKQGEEIAEALKLMRVAQGERDNLIAQLTTNEQESRDWKEREANLLNELAQARSGSVLGAQELLDSLASAEKSAQQMRQEHSTLLRQSQLRQQELERTCSDLSASLGDKEKEIAKLQLQLQHRGRDDATIRELENLRTQVAQLIATAEEERDKFTTMERRNKALDCELRANALSFQDERERNKDLVKSLESKILTLEEQAKEFSAAASKKRPTAISRMLADTDGTSNAGEGWEVVGDDSPDQRVVLEQVQQLSKQLLKKQGLVQELQAERAALKSRVLDLQNRCARTEQQLNALRDEEAGDMDSGEGGDDNSSGGRLMRRHSANRSGESGKRDHKVISDLEKIGVKAGPGVAKAVNMIDSWTLVTGRFLRVYPLVRLGFVLYLLFLHVWVFVVLAIHTHSLEELEGGPPVQSNYARPLPPFVNNNSQLQGKTMGMFPAGVVSG